MPSLEGDERILFVDDEESLVFATRQNLKELGYRVTGEHDPQEALERFRKSPYDFDIVITDMIMPGMTGKILAREILAIRPDIPVILCTGYSDQINEKEMEGMGIKAIVTKPYLVRDMAAAIRKVACQGRAVDMRPAES